MATYSSVFTPAASTAGGGGEDCQKVTTLAVTTASSLLSMGTRIKFVVVVVPAVAASATPTSGANIRFTNSAVTGSTTTASAADFMVPLNSALTFDTGDAWNQIEFFNPNTTTGATLDIYVMRLVT